VTSKPLTTAARGSRIACRSCLSSITSLPSSCGPRCWRSCTGSSAWPSDTRSAMPTSAAKGRDPDAPSGPVLSAPGDACKSADAGWCGPSRRRWQRQSATRPSASGHGPPRSLGSILVGSFGTASAAQWGLRRLMRDSCPPTDGRPSARILLEGVPAASRALSQRSSSVRTCGWLARGTPTIRSTPTV
jgi:hypothetical protein